MKDLLNEFSIKTNVVTINTKAFNRFMTNPKMLTLLGMNRINLRVTKKELVKLLTLDHLPITKKKLILEIMEERDRVCDLTLRECFDKIQKSKLPLKQQAILVQHIANNLKGEFDMGKFYYIAMLFVNAHEMSLKLFL